MVGKLRRLPAATQAALKELACLGTGAAVATLTLVKGGSEEALHAAVSPAVRAGLVLRQDGTYRFLHDRIQEAAYALIPERRRAAAHLAIGRRLVANTPPKAVEEKDLRDRRSAQPRRLADRLGRGARAARRVELDCRPPRQGLGRLRLGADLSHRRCGPVAGRCVGAPVRACLRARAAAGGMRVPDRRAG